MNRRIPPSLVGILALVWTAASAVAADMSLFDGKSVASVAYDPQGGVPISKAAALLSHDMAALTGRSPHVAAGLVGLKGPAVVIGLASSPEIAALLKANNIDASHIAGKWETYGRAMIPAPWDSRRDVLLIFGSDTRGTIWGVIDLTREMGVSPWEWWADVKIRRVASLNVDGTLRYSKEPGVKYRGIFLNDEEYGLFPWASKTYDPKIGNIGPKTYARIFELMWRLKANTFWPAMHTVSKAFNTVPGNPETADDYAIVHASSHVEMMLRSNPREWDNKTMGPYNWIDNRQRMIDYWKGAIEQWGKFENLYTVGLRGADDFPMLGVNTPEQMADVLSDVIAQQRKILSGVLYKPADEIPQVFTPYKEVLPAYNTGLVKLPGDITINWPDDNFGYIRRLSNAQERQRPGGSGVYYHISYWGGPMSYLWLASEDPSLMWEEMTKAYQYDAHRVWILNVGDVKPGEFLTQFFLAMAFAPDDFKDISSVQPYLRDWAVRSFGAEHAGEITGILWRYYKLAFVRNPEFMGWTTSFPVTAPGETKFNMLAFGDENARRAEAYNAIMKDAKALMAKMPADRKAAFFQLVQYPVDAAGGMNLRQLALDKSITYGLQHRQSANNYAQAAAAAQKLLDADARYYNGIMSGGKWRGMMGIQPHGLPIYESPHIPAWNSNGDKKCGLQMEGGAYYDGGGWMPSLPSFHRGLERSRYVDLFVEGPVVARWTLRPTEPWIKVSRASGAFDPQTKHFEDRIWVTVDWAAAPASGTGSIMVTCGNGKFHGPIKIAIAPDNQSKGASFIEADGIVSIYAVHADDKDGDWQMLDGLGYSGADIRTPLDMPSVDPARPDAVAKAPSMTYRFATTTTGDSATLSVFALPTHPITSDNGVRVLVSIDGGVPKLLDFNAPEFSGEWSQHVLSNEVTGRVHGLPLAPGEHTLKVTALDPGVTLDRFEIAFDGAPEAYAAVPETRIVH